MKTLLSVLTTRRPVAYLAETLRSLERAGAFEVDRMVFSDGPIDVLLPSGWPAEQLSSVREGIKKSMWAIFKYAFAQNVDRLIYTEDDVVFSKNAISYAASMRIPSGLAFVTFFLHNVWARKSGLPKYGKHWHIHTISLADNATWGNLFLVFERSVIEYLLAPSSVRIITDSIRSDPSREADVVLSKILGHSHWKAFGLHVPSLAQHKGDVSMGHPERDPKKPEFTNIFAGEDFDAMTLLMS